MRRSDREVTDPAEIVQIMSKCDVVRLALNTPTVPYILPVNFGMEPDGMTLYIHGAAQGTKYELIADDSRAGFEMDCCHGLVLDEAGHACTMNYESVIGWGEIDEVTEESEKLHALDCLMAQYHAQDFQYDKAPVGRTRILRLRIRERTAKRRRKMV